nr:MAG TPA: hypothetical protein [Caudoviricetes sp.]
MCYLKSSLSFLREATASFLIFSYDVLTISPSGLDATHF